LTLLFSLNKFNQRQRINKIRGSLVIEGPGV
jgi:hypothetical protein